MAERLGISTKSLYTWKGQFSKPVRVREAEADLIAELRRVKKELARVTEERNILKKATVRRPAGEWHIHREGTSRESLCEVRVYRGSSKHSAHTVIQCLEARGQEFGLPHDLGHTRVLVVLRGVPGFG